MADLDDTVRQHAEPDRTQRDAETPASQRDASPSRPSEYTSDTLDESRAAQDAQAAESRSPTETPQLSINTDTEGTTEPLSNVELSSGIPGTPSGAAVHPSPSQPQITVEASSSGQPEQDYSNVPVNTTRQRSDSRSTVATQATHRSTPVSSTVFVVTALETIAASKDARRSAELDTAVKAALENIKQADHRNIDPEVIFHPLQLAAKSYSIPLQVTALDCIGKLITYSYFAFPSFPAGDGNTPEDRPPLIERAIETICECFENESTPVEIQQQIIKSLLAAVLNDKIVVHGAGLLKAVRQIYNIFIYSKSSQNQHVAQGSLTQMVGTVYERVRIRLELKEARLREEENRGQGDASSQQTSLGPSDDVSPSEQDEVSETGTSVVTDQPVSKVPTTEKLTLQSFETNKDDALAGESAPTMVTRAKPARKTSSTTLGDMSDPNLDDEDEIYVKDAFLVFRALCKLSQKVLSHEQQQDIKSQNMRSKLLSLHLMQHLLNNHISVFTSPLATIRNSNPNGEVVMTLLQAVKPHLCLSLSRNGASAVPRVFEVCCEIFWLMLNNMRVMLKVRGLSFVGVRFRF
jgi:brefeldin A-inhibited guanine nucleotide-exchange protein